MKKFEKFITERIGKIVLLIISILVSIFSFYCVKPNILDYPETISLINSLFVIFNIGVFVYLFKD